MQGHTTAWFQRVQKAWLLLQHIADRCRTMETLVSWTHVTTPAQCGLTHFLEEVSVGEARRNPESGAVGITTGGAAHSGTTSRRGRQPGVGYRRIVGVLTSYREFLRLPLLHTTRFVASSWAGDITAHSNPIPQDSGFQPTTLLPVK